MINRLAKYHWCLHCEQVNDTKDWVSNDWHCPTVGCDGEFWDADPWGSKSWPKSNHPEYPRIPKKGVVYPLN